MYFASSRLISSAPRDREVVLLEDFGRVPAAYDDLAHQRRPRKLGDLAREFAALTFKLLVPIRRLLTAQAIGQTDLRSKPHMTASRQLLPALGMGYPP